MCRNLRGAILTASTSFGIALGLVVYVTTESLAACSVTRNGNEVTCSGKNAAGAACGWYALPGGVVSCAKSAAAGPTKGYELNKGIVPSMR